jgi:signal transduction histidine kinase
MICCRFLLASAGSGDLTLATSSSSEATSGGETTFARSRFRIVNLVRAIPIRWRILSIAALNSAVVLALAVLIWSGARGLNAAWDDVRQVRESEKILTLLDGETSRLQTLIHRYIDQPSPELFAEIQRLREAVLETLKTRASADPILSGSVEDLRHVTESFLNGFEELRTVQAAISQTYEQQVLAPARDMAKIYTAIEGTPGRQDALIWPELAKSRDAFTAMLVAANAYYLSLASESAADARTNTEAIERSIPAMSDLAENDQQRDALLRLRQKAAALREGLDSLSNQFAARATLLHDAIDGSQAKTIVVIDELSVKMHQREQSAQQKFDQTLTDISREVWSISLIFLAVIVIAGIIIALSIRLPLYQIITAMRAIASGDLNRKVDGTQALDEIGGMARSVEVFRKNAIAKRAAEEELRASKEKAEHTVVELNAAHRRLSAQWLRLQRANAFKNEVLGTVAHDLKNPLGVILGRAEMLSELIGVETARDTAAKQIEHISDATKRLTSMVDHLISDAMADAFDITIRREPVDIAALVHEVVEANRPSAFNKQQSLTVSAPAAQTAMCDADRMREVIDNLISNAIKYSPIGGKISLIVSHSDDDLCIRVTDEGAGLSPEDIGRLFGRFQRLSAKPTAGESSTGLGLSIVKRIIDMHGGTVSADSPGPGQGATFSVTLPSVKLPSQ